MRLGIFGGTFDPVHLGHLAAAEEVAYRLDLAQVLFVPAHHQPLKAQAPGASDAHRLAMLRLIAADNPRFAVSALELERPAPSYTVDTLRVLREAYDPDVEFYFLLGIDAVNSLHLWREAGEIVRLARLAVMSRSDVREPDWAALRTVAPDMAERLLLVAVPDIDLSSRDLRARIATRRPVRYQIPDPVRLYIEQHGLYRDPVPPVSGE